LKTKILSIMLLIMTSILISSCSRDSKSDGQVTEKAVYRKISAQEAKKMMEETEDYILVDVRTEQEFNAGHIEGALLIPDYEIKGTEVKELPDKDALILLYCRSGRRSAEAAHRMIQMGYTNLYDFGGIIDWPYEIVKEK
jgi:phage shock protein E